MVEILNCPLLFNCKSMTGIVGYRCPNYLDCLQQSGGQRECSVYYYYYWGEEGQLIVRKNAAKLGWAIAEELPCEYDFEISVLKVIKNQEKMGYYTPVLLPVQRKKIIIYPENSQHFYESVRALVVEPTASLPKNSELVNCGWHKAISIYPFWDKFCQDIYSYVENNILTKTKEYQSFDYLGTDYHVESVYHCPASNIEQTQDIQALEEDSPQFHVIVYWRISMYHEGNNYEPTYLINEQKLKTQIVSGQTNCWVSPFKPESHLKVRDFYSVQPNWLKKQKINVLE